MDLFNAIIKAGLAQENQIKKLSFKVVNSSGNRAAKAATTRYLVKLEGKLICSVKKLSVRSGYNIEMIHYLQGLLSENEIIQSPKVYGTFEMGSYLYIVEEYIQGITLREAIQRRHLSIDSSVSMVKQVFEYIQQQTTSSEGNNSTSIFKREVSTICKTINSLTIDKHIVARLEQDFRDNQHLLLSGPSITTGDLSLKNIICKDGDKYIVDFDLTHQTYLGWVDLLRLVHYERDSNICFKYNAFEELLPKIDLSFLRIIFLLKEIELQSRVLEAVYFNDIFKHLETQLWELCCEYYQIPPVEDEIQNVPEVIERPTNYVQVYWTDKLDEQYCEGKSTWKTLIVDTWETYVFELDTERIHSIRVDPTISTGLIEIGKIIILGERGEKLDITQELKVSGTIELLWDKEIFRGISIGDDPQLIFENLNLSGKAVLEFTMKVSTTIGDILSTDFQNHGKELKRFRSVYLDSLDKAKIKLHELNEELLNKKEENRIYWERIEYMEGSRSWKLTKPLRSAAATYRNLKMKMKSFIKKLLGEKKIHLVPIHHLAKVGDSTSDWVATGNDPQFEWNGPLLGGWVQLYYRGKAEEETVTLQLYYDSGEGMTAESFIKVGLLTRNNEHEQSALVKLPNKLKRLRLDPGDKPQTFSLFDFRARKISKLELLSRPLRQFIRTHGLSFATMKSMISKFILISKRDGLRGAYRKIRIHAETPVGAGILEYSDFIRLEQKTNDEYEKLKKEAAGLKYQPLVSVLIPVYNVEENWLRLCIESVQKQIYNNWELCIVDDCSTKLHIKKVLDEVSRTDKRIKVKYREENGHISRTSNDALAMAEGEFIALLDHDDELAVDALYENILLINKHMDADIIYSDEDKISTKGERHSPFFKPDWSPDMLMSQMYTCHLTLYRRNLVEKVGGFRVGYEGSQDYDLMLRVSEHTRNIFHIPKILYHWRSIPSSTALNSSSKNYTHVAGLRALEDTIIRRGLDATVESIEGLANVYLVRYQPVSNPKISIIIPTRNMTRILSDCLDSIFGKTSYNNFEVIIIDNGSDDSAIFDLYKHWLEAQPERFSVHYYDIPFNYSKLNNFGVAQATGELILLLNNDVTVITPDWLAEMAGQAMRSEVGAVGACLYYPDNTLQHGGVILGVGGIAGHSHKNMTANHPGYFGRLKVVSNYTAVTAACLMVRKAVFEEVGGLEEELQVAFNDVDLCLKIWEKGYYNVWLPHVQLYHYESKSRGSEDTPEKMERFKREIEWMTRRWAQLLNNDPCYNPNLSRDRDDFSLGEPYR
ncbi:glycosyltransferase [Paenibacillus sp. GCM10027626]|uniref:glycosyltransferase family 2 protein n=1 Tax=Paenibacillus sp. GCM10027626 TaxID=3273411 RepID=UPI003626F4D9